MNKHVPNVKCIKMLLSRSKATILINKIMFLNIFFLIIAYLFYFFEYLISSLKTKYFPEYIQIEFRINIF